MSDTNKLSCPSRETRAWLLTLSALTLSPTAYGALRTAYHPRTRPGSCQNRQARLSTHRACCVSRHRHQIFITGKREKLQAWLEYGGWCYCVVIVTLSWRWSRWIHKLSLPLQLLRLLHHSNFRVHLNLVLYPFFCLGFPVSLTQWLWDKSRNRLTLWCSLTQIMQVVWKHAKAHHHPNCSMVPTCYVPPALRKESLPWVRESQSFTLLWRGRQQDLEQSQCSKIWELTSGQNSTGSESWCVRWTRHCSTARSREDSSHCYSTLVGTKAHTRWQSQNHENPWNLEPGRSWNQTFLKVRLESRGEQKCKKSQDLILKFSLLTLHAKLTRSRKRKWSRNSVDHDSCDAVTKWCKPTVNRRAPLHKPNMNKRQCNANRTVRCQPDHDIVEHNFGHDCTKLFTDFFEF